MSTEVIAAVAVVSALVGAIGGLVAARSTWRKDRRDTEAAKIATATAKSTDDREREEAADRATDRLVEALKDANTVAIENERLKYENKLYEEITKLKKLHKQQFDEMRASLMAEMQRQIHEALDEYGCELAKQGCNNRRSPVRATDTASI